MDLDNQAHIYLIIIDICCDTADGEWRLYFGMCVGRNMDEVVRFPGVQPPKQLTYAAKQLIAREVKYLITIK